jgi:CheY-like chemotaxis protein
MAAASALEALDLLDTFRPDLLLSDIAMPHQDGYSLIRQVRQRLISQGREILAIALTAYAGEEDCVRARSAGFQAHISKPINPPDLLVRISEVANTPRTESPLLRLAR